MSTTHEVLNQVPPLQGHDVAAVPALLEGVEREGAGWSLESLHELGALAGRPETRELGRRAETYHPVLHTHDRYGHRIDTVDYDPAWHQLMTTAVARGLFGAPWGDERVGAHVARAAQVLVWTQVDAGIGCPMAMTYAVVPALRQAPELAEQYEPLLTSRVYEPDQRPPLEKAGLIAGMSMTEKQGGSDVRAGTTRAVEQPDGSYRLTGHKWFTSAPNSDLFLVLAQASGGLTCFLLPRVLADGSLNAMRLQRLKDKLGNRSNASSEVEYDEAVAFRVGDEGRGAKTIIEMVNMTRLDCVLGSSAGMLAGVAQATHHATYRAAFGKQLIDQPLMRNVLADLAIEAEAAVTVAMRLAGATDRAARGNEGEALLRRLALASTKYYVCKRGPGHAAEALECLGGNGYIEDSGLPRLYREAPLLSIWEGSGNVAALDTLRAMATQPQSVGAFFGEIALAAGGDARLDQAVTRLKNDLLDSGSNEHRARTLVEQMALVLQGALLVRHGHPAVADAFCASRLDRQHGQEYGTLPTGVDTAAILARAIPKAP